MARDCSGCVQGGLSVPRLLTRPAVFRLLELIVSAARLFVNAAKVAHALQSCSTWSRGQAWATLGFALMHNSTGIDLYLDTAKRAANYYLSHLPASGVAYWCVRKDFMLSYTN